ncbi:MAG: hypothetical protein AB7U73_00560 [Pirellulales bacterium]
MDENPKRRWFRFKLSTVLILTAIVASWMALRPSIRFRHYRWPQEHDQPGRVGITMQTDMPSLGIVMPGAENEVFDNFVVAVFYSKFEYDEIVVVHQRQLLVEPKSGLVPIVVLIGFLTWKGAGAIAKRRLARRAH